MLLIAGCASGPRTVDPFELQTRLSDPSRAASDRARDEGRKPAEVLTFLGMTPGMTAIDLVAAGGYYTEVLSAAVGPEGVVYAQNPARVLQFRDGANDKQMTARLAGNRLANVVRLDREIPDLGLQPESLDFAITALNFHDVHNNSPENALGMLRVVHALLKPGGVLGIIDHVGVAGADNARLHRMEKARAIATATSAGFTLAGESDILANPDDDHTQGVFAPGLRGATDRFLLKLTKR